MSQEWGNWREHVLAEIKRSNDMSSNFQDALIDIRVEIAELKVRSSVWGGLVGGLTGMTSFLVMLAIEKWK